MQTSNENKKELFTNLAMDHLIQRFREYLPSFSTESTIYNKPFDLNALEKDYKFTERKKGKVEIILKENTAVELGNPSSVSKSFILTSLKENKIQDGNITIIGQDLYDLTNKDDISIGQIVLLELDDNYQVDLFDMDNIQYLINRLPGYMVRSIPGRLWARISKKAIKKGLSFKVIGSAIINAFKHDLEYVKSCEVVFITLDKDAIENLSIIESEAAILSGKHKKVSLGIDGEAECDELNCEECEEKPVCDNLRDIVIKKRRQ